MTISETGNSLTVSELCRATGVTRSAYYNWLSTKELREEKEKRDLEDFLLILEAYQFRGYDKGVWGVHMRLLRMGVRMNHKKIRRLMRKYDLRCPIRQANPDRQIMKELRTSAVADNKLKREFKEHGARMILLTAITYIPLNSCFCYLSVILAACTMEVLSYVLSGSLKVDFVLMTVRILLRDHGDELKTNVLLHSDQGAHYTSHSFRDLLSEQSLRQSMSRKGNCWDNAPQESFFGHMKDELGIHSRGWNTIEEARTAIDDWMDYYNKDRYQRGLQKMAPTEYYQYLVTGKYPESMHLM